MPTKKKNGKRVDKHAINVRLTDEELQPVLADLAKLEASSGMPHTLTAYAKAAVKSFARLRGSETR